MVLISHTCSVPGRRGERCSGALEREAGWGCFVDEVHRMLREFERVSAISIAKGDHCGIELNPVQIVPAVSSELAGWLKG